MRSKWVLRWVTAMVWALAAGSVVFWGLRMGDGRSTQPLSLRASADAGADASNRQASLARFLGATNSVAENQAPTPAVSRFSLVGVVAEGQNGVALLVVDGKPAKPYRVGSRIDDSTVLRAVGSRHAELAATMDAATGQRLELPSQHASAAAPALSVPLIPGVPPAAAAAMLPLARRGAVKP